MLRYQSRINYSCFESSDTSIAIEIAVKVVQNVSLQAKILMKEILENVYKIVM
jgi:hypothetical protein